MKIRLIGDPALVDEVSRVIEKLVGTQGAVYPGREPGALRYYLDLSDVTVARLLHALTNKGLSP